MAAAAAAEASAAEVAVAAVPPGEAAVAAVAAAVVAAGVVVVVVVAADEVAVAIATATTGDRRHVREDHGGIRRLGSRRRRLCGPRAQRWRRSVPVPRHGGVRESNQISSFDRNSAQVSYAMPLSSYDTSLKRENSASRIS